MASEKAQLIDSIQKHLGKSNWKSVIADMEKLFAIDPDPIIRVRMGDAYQKMTQLLDAVKEYVYAADLYAAKGAIVKALAQYKLALRLDPKNKQAQDKIASLHSNKVIAEKKTQPVEESASKSVIPLFAGLSPEEFDDFTRMMAVHTLPPGHAIVKQGDTGKSVYIIASGTVKVYATLPTGERLTLAVLNPNDFFGEISFLTNKPRTATVETTEDSVILEVTEEQLRELTGKRPRVLEVLQQYSEARERGTKQKMQSAQKAATPAAAPPKISDAPKPSAAPPVQKLPPVNPAERPKLVDSIQKFISKGDWKSVIGEMEKLFTIDLDPIIRVRIGDAYQKLNQKSNAAREYIYAADLYAEKGAVVKALAQYKLALRIDTGNNQAQACIEALHSNKTVKENRAEPAEKETKKTASSVIPLFAGFSQEEFNAFTKAMNVHPLPEGMPIIEQHDGGKSVYIIANGSVKVYTAMLSGERVDLAVLHSGDFFGEMSFLTGKPRTATVETAEDSVILEVTEDKLREIISQQPRMLDVLQHYYEVRSKGTADRMKDSSKS
jgi:CRP-like cAMP-binding protein